MKLHMSACEIYMNDCFDLLNNKAKIPIAGFGMSKKANSAGLGRVQTNYDADGKWIPPTKTVITKKE